LAERKEVRYVVSCRMERAGSPPPLWRRIERQFLIKFAKSWFDRRDWSRFPKRYREDAAQYDAYADGGQFARGATRYELRCEDGTPTQWVRTAKRKAIGHPSNCDFGPFAV